MYKDSKLSARDRLYLTLCKLTHHLLDSGSLVSSITMGAFMGDGGDTFAIADKIPDSLEFKLTAGGMLYGLGAPPIDEILLKKTENILKITLPELYGAGNFLRNVFSGIAAYCIVKAIEEPTAANIIGSIVSTLMALDGYLLRKGPEKLEETIKDYKLKFRTVEEHIIDYYQTFKSKHQ